MPSASTFNPFLEPLSPKDPPLPFFCGGRCPFGLTPHHFPFALNKGERHLAGPQGLCPRLTKARITGSPHPSQIGWLWGTHSGLIRKQRGRRSERGRNPSLWLTLAPPADSEAPGQNISRDSLQRGGPHNMKLETSQSSQTIADSS